MKKSYCILLGLLACLSPIFGQGDDFLFFLELLVYFSKRLSERDVQSFIVLFRLY